MYAAFTVTSEFIVTWHVPVPLHVAPLQPVKLLPPFAVALSVTVAPTGNSAEHVGGQLIPAGVLVSTPNPVPLVVTVNAYDVAAVTVTDAVPLTVPSTANTVSGPPTELPVTNPSLTDAIPAFPVDHDTLSVNSCIEPSL